jgi:hypothetical protein
MVLQTVVIEFVDHSCARLIQRHPQADLRQYLFEAGREFLVADAEEVLDRFDHGHSIYLRTGPGAFAGTVIWGKDVTSRSTCLFARPSTWLTDEMMGRDQVPLGPAKESSASVAELVLQIAEESK